MADVATHSIVLEWKEFNISMDAVEAHLRANLSAAYCGNSCGSNLTLWFISEPTADDAAAVELYWESIIETSEEATSYQTAEQMKAAADAKQASDLASAVSALKALGLTDAQIAALRA